MTLEQMEKDMTHKIDLHLHTNASDGTLCPREAVEQAKAAGIEIMAVTDHDTVAGVPEARQAGRQLGVEVISGIEISAYYRGVNTHILGYGVDVTAEELKKTLDWIITERDERNERIAALMRGDGIEVTIEGLRAKYPGATIGRPHFARTMVEQGRASSVPEAFREWLNKGKPYYQPRKHLSMEDAVLAICRSGGIPVLAHPLQYGYSNEKLGELVAYAARLKVMGMEVYYTGYTPQQREKLLTLAGEFGMLITGGSDFHGDNKPDIRLGELQMPMAVGDMLRAKLREVQG